MSKQIGMSSTQLAAPVYIREWASAVGKKEGEGPLGQLFDFVSGDDLLGNKTWEEAESAFQKKAVSLLFAKDTEAYNRARFILAGDLLGQEIASSFGIKDFRIPMFGLYGACSTCGESLSLGSMLIDGGFAEQLVCVTSSHFASAEKEFRYPLDYGSQRPPCSTWTVTGSGAYLLSREPGGHLSEGGKTTETCVSPTGHEEERNTGHKAADRQMFDLPQKCLIERKHEVAITAVTTGKIMDYGIKDSMNMGACMASAACDTIYRHLKDFDRQPGFYDKIITGDLGTVGQQILIDLLMQKGYDISDRHMDCGIEIFNGEEQGTNAGGSGCGCAASVLAAYLLPRVASGEWKRILFLPTGALLSKVSFNEGKSIPGIAHAVVIEQM